MIHVIIGTVDDHKFFSINILLNEIPHHRKQLPCPPPLSTDQFPPPHIGVGVDANDSILQARGRNIYLLTFMVSGGHCK